MKTIISLLLAAAALPVLAYDLKIADAPTTVTNTVVTGTLPPIDVTRADQFAVCIVAHMEQTQAGGTNLVSLPGLVSCVASNSIDGQTWFADDARGFSLSVPTNGVVTLQTNFTGMGAIGFEQYTLSVSNNAAVSWTTAVKPGL